MQRLDGLSRPFLIAVVVYVTGRWLGHPLIPRSGSVAVIALAGLVWARPLPHRAARWTKTPLVSGLALLANLLARPGLSEVSLRGAACAAVAAGDLGRAGQLIRWRNLSAAGFAVNAALLSRRAVRWAGVGLLSALALALPLLPAVQDEERYSALMRPKPKPIPSLNFVATREGDGLVIRSAPLRVPKLGYPPVSTLPAIAVPAQPPAVDKAVSAVRDKHYDLRAALLSGLLFMSLAAIATSLFPYRE